MAPAGGIRAPPGTCSSFDNTSFLAHVFNQLFISTKVQSVKHLTAQWFNNLFRTVKKTNHIMEVGWLKRMKCMAM